MPTCPPRPWLSHHCLALGVALAALALVLAPASAPARPSFGADAELNSRYLWRGMTFSEGAVFQPAAWVEAGPATLTLWGNWDLERGGGPNEVDVTLSAGFNSGGFELTPSALFYAYPEPGVDATVELQLEVKSPTRAGVGLSTLQSVDVAAHEGAAYSKLQLEWAAAVPRAGALSLGAGVARGTGRFARAYLDEEAGDVTHLSLAASWRIPVGTGLELRPHAEANPLMGEARRLASDPRPACLGIILSAEF